MAAASFTESLARYAATGEEAAFADVVRVAGPLVWRVAMRRLHDAHLAEEAAQNVFVTLARKARAVAARPGALAWLHRAATLEAANLARSRARREHRHRVMATEPTLLPAAPSPDDPSPAGAWLDEAIDRLPAADRELLLGRFFEGLSFRELGARTGKTEEAVKKQSQRALERLRRGLGRRRVTLSATALASVLGAEFASAALPSSLTASLTVAATIPAATLSTTGSLCTSCFAAMSTTKAVTASAVVLLLLLVTAEWQQRRIAELKERVSHNSRRLESARVAIRTGATSEHATPIVFRKRQDDTTWPDPLTGEALVRMRTQGSPFGLYEPGLSGPLDQQRLAAVPEEEWPRLLREIDATPAEGFHREETWSALLAAWAKRRPDWAVSELARRDSRYLGSALYQWTQQDPVAAWAWLTGQLAEGGLIRHGAGPLKDLEKSGWKHFVMGLKDTGIKPLRAFLKAQKDSPFQERLATEVGALSLARDGVGPTIGLLAETTSPAAIRAILAENLGFLLSGEKTPAAIAATAHELLEESSFPHGAWQVALRERLASLEPEQFWQAPVLMAAFSPREQQWENLAWLVARLEERDPAQARRLHPLEDKQEQQVLDEAARRTALALALQGRFALAETYMEKILNETMKAEIRSLLEKSTSTPSAR